MELFEFVKEFIRPELLVLVPVLYFVGVGLKKAQAFADKYIPLALGAAGIALSVLYVLATAQLGGWQNVLLAAFTAVTQGLLAAGCSVYVNQIVKQTNK